MVVVVAKENLFKKLSSLLGVVFVVYFVQGKQSFSCKTIYIDSTKILSCFKHETAQELNRRLLFTLSRKKSISIIYSSGASYSTLT